MARPPELQAGDAVTIHPLDAGRSAADAIERAARDVAALDPRGPLRPGDFFAYAWHSVNGVRKPGHCGLIVSVPGYDGPMPASVLRAEAAARRGAIYDLGAGGLEDDGRGDCSGALLEWLGVERVQPCEGWSSINTSAMVANALGSQSIFRHVSGPVPWSECGVIDCSASHPRGRAVGHRAGGGTLWARAGIPIRVV